MNDWWTEKSQQSKYPPPNQKKSIKEFKMIEEK